MTTREWIIGIVTVLIALSSSVVSAVTYSHTNFIGIREMDRVYLILTEIKTEIKKLHDARR